MIQVKRPVREMVAEANQAVRTISLEEAHKLLGQDDVQFVDVREKHEFDAGTIPGAVSVPRGLLEWLADPAIPTHRKELHSGKRLVLFCASGGRSALAAKTLTEMGFPDVCHIEGGYNAWKQGGLPV